MDTPERGHQPPPAQQQIGTPVSRVEDSPVFNYINSLSPIKPVKPLHITQSFQSLNFTTIPVFTSPHVNTHKGSRFSTRHPLSDLSKSEDISNNGGKTTQCMGVSHDAKLSDFSVTAREGHDIRCSLDESTIVSFDECPSQSNKLSQSLPYDCGSPNHNTAPFYGGKSSINLATNSNLMIDYIHDDLEETEKPVASDLELRNGCHIQESNQEVQGCDWENMITDGSEGLLVCESYTEVDTSKACALAVDHDMNATTHSSRPSEDTVSNSQKTQVDESLVYFQDALQEPLVESQSETSHTLQPFSGSCENPLSGEASEEMDNGIGDYMPLDNEVHSQQQRGMRRRCLVFETAGANRKLLHNDTNRSLPTLLSSQGKFSSGDRHSKSSGTRVGPSPHGLPSIGLHLNSICSTSKERMPKNETASQKQLSMLGSIHPFPSLRTDQKPLEQISISVEKDCQSVVGVDQDLQVTCDTLQAPVTAVAKGEESNCSSPKKKKRISESSNESDSCKRCNCKKSKCLKLYCECFAAGVYCVEPCACQGCLNNPMHEDTVLATRKQIESRNPLAFAPKVIRTSEPVLEIGEEANKTPASARHKRGCNCKKSNCLKKYCECYQGGVGCSINCRCEGCKNKFGTKDGKMPNENEETGHDEEIDAYEKYGGKRDNLRITNVQNDEQKKIESALPVTPSFEVSRPAAKPPCPSTGKPPRSTMLIKLNGFRTLQKFEMVPHRPKFENHSRVTPEDETPEMLRDDASSPCQSNISSPKRKRVSPPHNESGISPIHKGSRKLILKSIPSFPSLISDPDYEFSANSSNPPISSQLDQDIS